MYLTNRIKNKYENIKSNLTNSFFLEALNFFFEVLD